MTTLFERVFTNSTYFTSPGNWTAPAVASEVYLLGSGGGGGGGGGGTRPGPFAGVSASGGAGGASIGAWVRTNIDPGQVYAISVGLGGDGGRAANPSPVVPAPLRPAQNGANGGATSFIGQNVNVIFPGGAGGVTGAAQIGGGGGQSGNGYYSKPGRNSSPEQSQQIYTYAPYVSLLRAKTDFPENQFALAGGAGGISNYPATPGTSNFGDGNSANDPNGGLSGWLAFTLVAGSVFAGTTGAGGGGGAGGFLGIFWNE